MALLGPLFKLSILFFLINLSFTYVPKYYGVPYEDRRKFEWISCFFSIMSFVCIWIDYRREEREEERLKQPVPFKIIIKDKRV